MVDVKRQAPAAKISPQDFVNALNVADRDGKLDAKEERLLKDAFKAMSPEDRAAAMEMARNSGHAALAAHMAPANVPKPGMNAAERKGMDAFMKERGVPEAQRGPLLDRFEKLDPSARQRQKDVMWAALDSAKVGGIQGERWNRALADYSTQLNSAVDGTPAAPNATAAAPGRRQENVQKESVARDAQRATAQGCTS